MLADERSVPYGSQADTSRGRGGLSRTKEDGARSTCTAVPGTDCSFEYDYGDDYMDSNSTARGGTGNATLALEGKKRFD